MFTINTPPKRGFQVVQKGSNPTFSMAKLTIV